MARRIARHFIDSLLNQLDIVSVIQSRLPLKKKGRDFEACCPFHEEKTPSFKVSPGKQIYHCFGSCGITGNAIGFVMRYDNLPFAETVEKLADQYGIPVVYDSAEDSHKVESEQDLYKIIQASNQFYLEQLQAETGKTARSYLVQRGVEPAVIERFALGFAPDGNALLKRFMPTFSADKLRQVGLLGQSEPQNGAESARHYDVFRNRLMFPIRDVRGRVMAFGARALAENQQPKYLNTGETPLFAKRSVLYGLYEALKTLKKIDHLIVVEGYMDVVALHQHGVYGAVATLGTAFTKEHIELLRKYCKKITICFDGDSAGQKAAERAALTLLPFVQLEDELRFAVLPVGDDPDSLVRKIGKTAFVETLRQGALLSEYLYGTWLADRDTSSPEGLGEVIARAKSVFDNLPDTDYKTLLYQGFVQKIGVDIYRPATSVRESPISSKYHQPTQRVPRAIKQGFQRTALTRLIRLLLEQPSLAHYAQHVNVLSSMPELDAVLLAQLLSTIQYHDHLNWSIFSDAEFVRLKQILDKEPLGKHDIDETEQAQFARILPEFLAGLSQVINKKLRQQT